LDEELNVSAKVVAVQSEVNNELQTSIHEVVEAKVDEDIINQQEAPNTENGKIY
jgi:hypothetical protein